LKNDLLRKARLDHGWTQERLAEELNVGEETIRSWENGRRSPGIAMRNRLCEIFGRTAVQLGLHSPATVPLKDLLEAPEQDPPEPIKDFLDASEQDAPQTINDLLDTSKQDALEPTFKKRKTIRGRTRRIAALMSILTVLLLILYFILPRFSLPSLGKRSASSPTPTTKVLSSGSPTPTTGPTPTIKPTSTTGPTPTIEPTPTTGPTPTVGPTPTPGANLPSLARNSDLGPLNFQGYCQASGNTGAVLDQNNASGWRCVTPSGSRLPVDTDAACQWQYKQSDSLSRMVNFSDPNDWRCYSHVRSLGGVNFDQYCQSLGLLAHLSGQTVYDWRCSSASSTDNGQLIDVNSACLQQYKGFDSMASITNYFDPNGWRCIGIRVMLVQPNG
jgi:transcriptional regulator with XRE-family HTH domain